VSVSAFDHVAIPIEDTEAMLAFYRALGFAVDDAHAPLFYSIHFGDQKINLHGPRVWRSETFTLRGPTAKPGCGDFCFVWEGSQATLEAALDRAGARVIEGPVERDGGRDGGRAMGTSLYVRDPDSNLLEFMIYP
jgi:catechol 2,3-dioxygenase-like lactoylglutathione lyase family enzyme